ncbi:MAG: M20/M25/M40 family metallo-hydrolase [Deltaproteobacteria bacterium]|nr:M20/M25/M40 family metallo-hydrolase [Deltaproteobacteria bacterium]
MNIAWDSVSAEATGYLQQLLRIDTTNPPGNELAAARWLAAILAREGFSPQLIEPAPGRANVVCRYTTGGTDGPLLLSSHVDVVPAEAAHWTHPPFDGVLADGYIWGRGALDMKSMTIYQLMTLLLLKRHGLRVRRDVILAATADEEVGCQYGSAYLVEHHADLIRAAYALNEVGGMTLHIGAQRLYPIEVAQKGIVWVNVRARGTPGHGSKPHADMAVARLGQALHRLTTRRLPLHRTAAALDFVQAIAAASPVPQRWWLRGITLRGVGDYCARALPLNQQTAFLLATLHNTACPTSLRAGSGDSVNVIPSEAELSVDGRILPGQTQADFLAELQMLLGPGYEYEVIRYRAPLEQPRDTPLFATIARVVAAADPGARAVPFMITGFDDAHFYQRLGIVTYGFQPLRCPRGFDVVALAHAHDERIPLDGFHWGVRTLYDVVKEFVT